MLKNVKLGACMLQLKIPHATTIIQGSQKKKKEKVIVIYLKKKEK